MLQSDLKNNKSNNKNNDTTSVNSEGQTALSDLLKGHEMVGKMNSGPVQKKEVLRQAQQPVRQAQQPIQEDIQVPGQAKTTKNQIAEPVEAPASKVRSDSIPEDVQAKMENSFATSFADVKTLRNDESASQMGALAFTQGNNVHFAPGQFNPSATAGQELLGHELTHVVQQRQGRVQPTQGKGISVNDDPGLENEADVMGKRAAQGKMVSSISAVEHSVQKADTPTPKNYKKFIDFKGMTLSALHTYANSQADWHASPHLKITERDSVRTILSFTREDNVRVNCGSILFNDIYANLQAAGGNNDLVFNPLRLYSKVSATSDPFKISRVSTTGEGILIGDKLKTLITGVPSFILKTAMHEGPFNLFNTVSDMQKLVDYYQKAQFTPIFQSASKRIAGNDFGAYTLLNKQKYPLEYDSTAIKGYIRSYHRFEKGALDKLVSNFGDTSKSKPLTVILHTAIDHNGAFIRDSTLTDVIRNNNLHVLMVEGQETLGDYKTAIQPLAQKYGKNNKVDQVMFAGHGNSQSIQLGGKIEEDKRTQVPDPSDSSKMIPNPNLGKIKEVSKGIDVKSDPTGAQAIFDEVLDNMNLATDSTKQPHRRILFNACLTNSNSIPMTGGMSAAKARTAIQTWLSNNKNLVDTVLNRATAKGSDLTKVVGSVASHGSLDMFDSHDNLDLISSYDPQLTAPNKINYVKDGKEPLGVLRAVHEIWASSNSTTRATLLAEVKKRSGAGSSDWRNVIIESIFKIIMQPTNWANSDLIMAMQFVAYYIDHCRSAANCKVNSLSSLESIAGKTPVSTAHLTTIFAAMKTSGLWGAQSFIPVVFYQVWMVLDPSSTSIPSDLSSHVNAKYSDIKTLRDYIDVRYMNQKGLFKSLLKNKGNIGEIKIALIGSMGGNADCNTFLKNELVSDKFPMSHKIDSLLGGVSNELKILEKLGVYTPPTKSTSTSTSTTSKNANLAIYGDTQNTVNVESITKTGITKSGFFARTTSVYKEPDLEATKFADLPKGKQVFILGSVGDWWAIEYTHSGTLTTAFVKKGRVNF